MLLRQTEVEKVDALISTPAQGSAAGGYAQTGQEAAVRAATQQEMVVTTPEAQAARFDAGEALRVALCMAGLAALSNMVIGYLTAATAGMLMPFPVGSGTVRGLISFAVLVLNVAAVGFGVGLLANRRTMTASIVAANIAGLLVTVAVFVYFYVTLPPDLWAASTFSTFGILFRAVTVTVTEVAVAHYVARKFRKEP